MKDTDISVGDILLYTEGTITYIFEVSHVGIIYVYPLLGTSCRVSWSERPPYRYTFYNTVLEGMPIMKCDTPNADVLRAYTQTSYTI